MNNAIFMTKIIGNRERGRVGEPGSGETKVEVGGLVGVAGKGQVGGWSVRGWVEEEEKFKVM